MGTRNYLIEGVSGTGKSSVCRELRRRGYQAIDGDNELAYQGDPEAGDPIDDATHDHHIWDVAKVRYIAENQDEERTFFCGGSRNFAKFIDLFDKVFVLEVDAGTLNKRLENRPENPWGMRPEERELILKLHATKEDVPRDGISIDATLPLERVVDEIVRQAEAA
jgi:gluconate kinase